MSYVRFRALEVVLVGPTSNLDIGPKSTRRAMGEYRYLPGNLPSTSNLNTIECLSQYYDYAGTVKLEPVKYGYSSRFSRETIVLCKS
jgi:hypothetical protein